MTEAFVLGNGISRKGIDLPKLNYLGPIYGCNALYRDYSPDVLVATDKPIFNHIQSSGYSNEHIFYTRKPIRGLGAKTVIKKYYGYSSGPNALALAAEDGYSVVYFVGFDMGPNTNQKFNNVYADSEFYKKSSAPPTFTGNWIRQIKTVINDYPNTKFIRVTGPTSATVNEFDGIQNLTHMSLSDFLSHINTL